MASDPYFSEQKRKADLAQKEANELQKQEDKLFESEQDVNISIAGFDSFLTKTLTDIEAKEAKEAKAAETEARQEEAYRYKTEVTQPRAEAEYQYKQEQRAQEALKKQQEEERKAWAKLAKDVQGEVNVASDTDFTELLERDDTLVYDLSKVSSANQDEWKKASDFLTDHPSFGASLGSVPNFDDPIVAKTIPNKASFNRNGVYEDEEGSLILTDRFFAKVNDRSYKTEDLAKSIYQSISGNSARRGVKLEPKTSEQDIKRLISALRSNDLYTKRKAQEIRNTYPKTEGTETPGELLAGGVSSEAPPVPENQPLITSTLNLTQRPFVFNKQGELTSSGAILYTKETEVYNPQTEDMDTKEVTYVIPNVDSEGKLLSDSEAIEKFNLYGKHYGAYGTEEEADKIRKDIVRVNEETMKNPTQEQFNQIMVELRRIQEDNEKLVAEVKGTYEAPGQLEKGNIDTGTDGYTLAHAFLREQNAYPSTLSATYEKDGRFYIIPMVTPQGFNLSYYEAIDQFNATGKHYGVFDTEQNANKYAVIAAKRKRLEEESMAKMPQFDNLSNPLPPKTVNTVMQDMAAVAAKFDLEERIKNLDPSTFSYWTPEQKDKFLAESAIKKQKDTWRLATSLSNNFHIDVNEITEQLRNPATFAEALLNSYLPTLSDFEKEKLETAIETRIEEKKYVTEDDKNQARANVIYEFLLDLNKRGTIKLKSTELTEMIAEGGLRFLENLAEDYEPQSGSPTDGIRSAMQNFRSAVGHTADYAGAELKSLANIILTSPALTYHIGKEYATTKKGLWDSYITALSKVFTDPDRFPDLFNITANKSTDPVKDMGWVPVPNGYRYQYLRRRNADGTVSIDPNAQFVSNEYLEYLRQEKGWDNEKSLDILAQPYQMGNLAFFDGVIGKVNYGTKEFETNATLSLNPLALYDEEVFQRTVEQINYAVEINTISEDKAKEIIDQITKQRTKSAASTAREVYDLYNTMETIAETLGSPSTNIFLRRLYQYEGNFNLDFRQFYDENSKLYSDEDVLKEWARLTNANIGSAPVLWVLNKITQGASYGVKKTLNQLGGAAASVSEFLGATFNQQEWVDSGRDAWGAFNQRSAAMSEIYRGSPMSEFTGEIINLAGQLAINYVTGRAGMMAGKLGSKVLTSRTAAAVESAYNARAASLTLSARPGATQALGSAVTRAALHLPMVGARVGNALGIGLQIVPQTYSNIFETRYKSEALKGDGSPESLARAQTVANRYAVAGAVAAWTGSIVVNTKLGLNKMILNKTTMGRALPSGPRTVWDDLRNIPYNRMTNKQKIKACSGIIYNATMYAVEGASTELLDETQEAIFTVLFGEGGIPEHRILPTRDLLNAAVKIAVIGAVAGAAGGGFAGAYRTENYWARPDDSVAPTQPTNPTEARIEQAEEAARQATENNQTPEQREAQEVKIPKSLIDEKGNLIRTSAEVLNNTARTANDNPDARPVVSEVAEIAGDLNQGASEAEAKLNSLVDNFGLKFENKEAKNQWVKALLVIGAQNQIQLTEALTGLKDYLHGNSAKKIAAHSKEEVQAELENILSNLENRIAYPTKATVEAMSFLLEEGFKAIADQNLKLGIRDDFKADLDKSLPAEVRAALEAIEFDGDNLIIEDEANEIATSEPEVPIGAHVRKRREGPTKRMSEEEIALRTKAILENARLQLENARSEDELYHAMRVAEIARDVVFHMNNESLSSFYDRVIENLKNKVAQAETEAELTKAQKELNRWKNWVREVKTKSVDAIIAQQVAEAEALLQQGNIPITQSDTGVATPVEIVDPEIIEGPVEVPTLAELYSDYTGLQLEEQLKNEVREAAKMQYRYKALDRSISTYDGVLVTRHVHDWINRAPDEQTRQLRAELATRPENQDAINYIFYGSQTYNLTPTDSTTYPSAVSTIRRWYEGDKSAYNAARTAMKEVTIGVNEFDPGLAAWLRQGQGRERAKRIIMVSGLTKPAGPMITNNGGETLVLYANAALHTVDSKVDDTNPTTTWGKEVYANVPTQPMDLFQWIDARMNKLPRYLRSRVRNAITIAKQMGLTYTIAKAIAPDAVLAPGSTTLVTDANGNVVGGKVELYTNRENHIADLINTVLHELVHPVHLYALKNIPGYEQHMKFLELSARARFEMIATFMIDEYNKPTSSREYKNAIAASLSDLAYGLGLTPTSTGMVSGHEFASVALTNPLLNQLVRESLGDLPQFAMLSDLLKIAQPKLVQDENGNWTVQTETTEAEEVQLSAWAKLLNAFKNFFRAIIDSLRNPSTLPLNQEWRNYSAMVARINKGKLLLVPTKFLRVVADPTARVNVDSLEAEDTVNRLGTNTGSTRYGINIGPKAVTFTTYPEDPSYYTEQYGMNVGPESITPARRETPIPQEVLDKTKDGLDLIPKEWRKYYDVVNGEHAFIYRVKKLDVRDEAPPLPDEASIIEDDNGNRMFRIRKDSTIHKNHYHERFVPLSENGHPIGFKVFRLVDGKLYPPMVGNPGNVNTPEGVWIYATPGDFVIPKTGKLAGVRRVINMKSFMKSDGTIDRDFATVKNWTSSNTLAHRSGWHLGDVPMAIQFNVMAPWDKKGQKPYTYFPDDLVWAMVEFSGSTNYQDDANSYGFGKNKDGEETFDAKMASIPVIPSDGFYAFRTSPDEKTDEWVISGAMRVLKVLTRDEVHDLVLERGNGRPTPVYKDTPEAEAKLFATDYSSWVKEGRGLDKSFGFNSGESLNPESTFRTAEEIIMASNEPRVNDFGFAAELRQTRPQHMIHKAWRDMTNTWKRMKNAYTSANEALDAYDFNLLTEADRLVVRDNLVNLVASQQRVADEATEILKALNRVRKKIGDESYKKLYTACVDFTGNLNNEARPEVIAEILQDANDELEVAKRERDAVIASQKKVVLREQHLLDEELKAMSSRVANTPIRNILIGIERLLSDLTPTVYGELTIEQATVAYQSQIVEASRAYLALVREMGTLPPVANTRLMRDRLMKDINRMGTYMARTLIENIGSHITGKTARKNWIADTKRTDSTYLRGNRLSKPKSLSELSDNILSRYNALLLLGMEETTRAAHNITEVRRRANERIREANYRYKRLASPYRWTDRKGKEHGRGIIWRRRANRIQRERNYMAEQYLMAREEATEYLNSTEFGRWILGKLERMRRLIADNAIHLARGRGDLNLLQSARRQDYLTRVYLAAGKDNKFVDQLLADLANPETLVSREQTLSVRTINEASLHWIEEHNDEMNLQVSQFVDNITVLARLFDDAGMELTEDTPNIADIEASRLNRLYHGIQDEYKNTKLLEFIEANATQLQASADTNPGASENIWANYRKALLYLRNTTDFNGFNRIFNTAMRELQMEAREKYVLDLIPSAVNERGEEIPKATTLYTELMNRASSLDDVRNLIQSNIPWANKYTINQLLDNPNADVPTIVREIANHLLSVAEVRMKLQGVGSVVKLTDLQAWQRTKLTDLALEQSYKAFTQALKKPRNEVSPLARRKNVPLSEQILLHVRRDSSAEEALGTISNTILTQVPYVVDIDGSREYVQVYRNSGVLADTATEGLTVELHFSSPHNRFNGKFTTPEVAKSLYRMFPPAKEVLRNNDRASSPFGNLKKFWSNPEHGIFFKLFGRANMLTLVRTPASVMRNFLSTTLQGWHAGVFIPAYGIKEVFGPTQGIIHDWIALAYLHHLKIRRGESLEGIRIGQKLSEAETRYNKKIERYQELGVLDQGLAEFARSAWKQKAFADAMSPTFELLRTDSRGNVEMETEEDTENRLSNSFYNYLMGEEKKSLARLIGEKTLKGLYTVAWKLPVSAYGLPDAMAKVMLFTHQRRTSALQLEVQAGRAIERSIAGEELTALEKEIVKAKERGGAEWENYIDHAAANRVKSLLPTASRTPDWVKKTGLVVAPFFMFQYHTFMSLFHNVIYACEEFRDGNYAMNHGKKLEGTKLMAHAVQRLIGTSTATFYSEKMIYGAMAWVMPMIIQALADDDTVRKTKLFTGREGLRYLAEIGGFSNYDKFGTNLLFWDTKNNAISAQNLDFLNPFKLTQEISHNLLDLWTKPKDSEEYRYAHDSLVNVFNSTFGSASMGLQIINHIMSDDKESMYRARFGPGDNVVSMNSMDALGNALCILIGMNPQFGEGVTWEYLETASRAIGGNVPYLQWIVQTAYGMADNQSDNPFYNDASKAFGIAMRKSKTAEKKLGPVLYTNQNDLKEARNVRWLKEDYWKNLDLSKGVDQLDAMIEYDFENITLKHIKYVKTARAIPVLAELVFGDDVAQRESKIDGILDEARMSHKTFETVKNGDLKYYINGDTLKRWRGDMERARETYKGNQEALDKINLMEKIIDTRVDIEPPDIQHRIPGEDTIRTLFSAGLK